MWCGACVAPVMAAAPEKHVQAPWSGCRAFGRKEAATWGGSKVEIDLEVALGLCNPMSVGQRLRSVAAVGRAHADSQIAVADHDDRRRSNVIDSKRRAGRLRSWQFLEHV